MTTNAQLLNKARNAIANCQLSEEAKKAIICKLVKPLVLEDLEYLVRPNILPTDAAVKLFTKYKTKYVNSLNIGQVAIAVNDFMSEYRDNIDDCKEMIAEIIDMHEIKTEEKLMDSLNMALFTPMREEATIEAFGQLFVDWSIERITHISKEVFMSKSKTPEVTVAVTEVVEVQTEATQPEVEQPIQSITIEEAPMTTTTQTEQAKPVEVTEVAAVAETETTVEVENNIQTKLQELIDEHVENGYSEEMAIKMAEMQMKALFNYAVEYNKVDKVHKENGMGRHHSNESTFVTKVIDKLHIPAYYNILPAFKFALPKLSFGN